MVILVTYFFFYNSWKFHKVLRKEGTGQTTSTKPRAVVAEVERQLPRVDTCPCCAKMNGAVIRRAHTTKHKYF